MKKNFDKRVKREESSWKELEQTFQHHISCKRKIVEEKKNAINMFCQLEQEK